MSSEISIEVTELGKCYRLYDTPEARLKQLIIPPLRRILGKPCEPYYKEFWALQDVSFKVGPGEVLGIVGRNGSGKSTLLQLISGTLCPTVGGVRAHGRIGALLELGSGFNPEFTGRENVYLNGALLGFKKAEIDGRIDDIIGFADIGSFIDQPVKSYSSGMLVRLAFSVQAQLEPEILIVDEALAVGDARFQAKCFERLRQLKALGTTIIMVSHSGEQIVTHCTHAILLDRGRQIYSGVPRDVVNRYMDLLFGVGDRPVEVESSRREKDYDAPLDLSEQEDVFHTRPGANQHQYRWGDRKAIVLDFLLVAGGREYPTSVESGIGCQLFFTVRFLEFVHDPVLGVTIKTKEGVTVCGSNTDMLEMSQEVSKCDKGVVIGVTTSFVCRLAPGAYFISVGVASKDGNEVVPHDRRYDAIGFEVRKGKAAFYGLADLGMSMRIAR